MAETFSHLYDGDEDLNDIEDDIIDFINSLPEGSTNEWGFLKGKIRIVVEHIPEGGCECKGFQHDRDCHNWVMSF